MTDKFSTVRFLARHEIGTSERIMLERWHKKLHTITRPGGASNKALGISDVTHFKIEQIRVNKYLKNLPL